MHISLRHKRYTHSKNKNNNNNKRKQTEINQFTEVKFEIKSVGMNRNGLNEPNQFKLTISQNLHTDDDKMYGMNAGNIHDWNQKCKSIA